MSQVFPGRYTAHFEEPFVVFLIGMRVNQLFQFRKWVEVSRAMPPMIQELYDNPDLGFLGAENFFRLFPLTTLLLSYWRSFEHLEQYARSKNHEHLPAWRKFNQTVGNDGSVGIWHETYLVSSGQHETFYGNMPKFGLGAATEHVPAVGRRETARRRLGGENEPAVPSLETSDP
jgi:hypothetical protein